MKIMTNTKAWIPAGQDAEFNKVTVDGMDIKAEISGLEDGTKSFTQLKADEATLGKTTITAENTAPLIVNHTGPAGGYVLDIQKDGSSVAAIDTTGVLQLDTVYCQSTMVQRLVGVPSFTTALRPTMNLIVGGHIFDKTLGKPIWCKQVSPSVIWVDAAGTTV